MMPRSLDITLLPHPYIFFSLKCCMIQCIYKPHFLFIGIPIHDTLALQCKGVLRSDSTSLVNVAIFGIRYLGRKFIAFDDSYSVVLVVTRTVSVSDSGAC